MSRIPTSILAALLVATSATLASGAEVIGAGAFLHIVSDLDKSVAFYRALLGVEGAPAGPRPVSLDPELEQLYNLPGGREGAGVVRIPGSGLSVELVEWRDVERTSVRPRLQDPGATTLVLSVRDLDKAAALLTDLTGSVGRTAGPSPALFARDPDGFFIKVVQAGPSPPSNVPATSNVVGASFAVTVNDTEQTLRFYHDVFGFAPTMGTSFGRDASWTTSSTADLSGAQVRKSTALVPSSSPGSPVEVVFLEFRNVDRTPLRSRLQDPGTPILRLMVRDIGPVVADLKAAGAPIMSTGGGSVLRHNAPITIARDPNNLYLEPMQPAPAAR